MSRDTQADRCNRLADYLESLPESRYYHGAFVDNRASAENECGTVCCALGHAAGVSLTQFVGLGLELQNATWRGGLEMVRTGENVELRIEEYADAYFGDSAYARVFSEDAYLDYVGPTRDEVADRLRSFAEGLES